MKKVKINFPFVDRYTGKEYIAGKTTKMTEERIAEVKSVNPLLISVVGNVEEPKNPGDEKADGKKSGDEKADKEPK